MTYWVIQLTLWRKDGENMVKVPLYYAGWNYQFVPYLTGILQRATIFTDANGRTRATNFARELTAELAQQIPNADIEIVEAYPNERRKHVKVTRI